MPTTTTTIRSGSQIRVGFFAEYQGIGIARGSDDAYATEITPAGRSEETLFKSPFTLPVGRNPFFDGSPGDSLDPATILVDSKLTDYKFVVTGHLTLVNGVTADEKRNRLKNLYGFNLNENTFCTLAVKNIAGIWETYQGIITRLTFARNGGESLDYELIMEFTVGVTDVDV